MVDKTIGTSSIDNETDDDASQPRQTGPRISFSAGKTKWLDTVFEGQYLLSLSINYVAINKVLEKLPPQLY